MGNENSGPKPKPTALKLLRGVTRKDRLNTWEPRTVPGDVVKPDGLSEEAGAVWDKMAPLCVEMKTLTAVDVPAFAAYCEVQAKFDAAVKGKKLGPVLQTANALRPYFAMFGMEPASRSRIQVPQSEAPRSKVANLK